MLSSLIMSSSLLWLGSSPSAPALSEGVSPMSIENMTILGVMVDIWLEKQYLYTPSMCAANVYLPFDSRSPWKSNEKGVNTGVLGLQLTVKGSNLTSFHGL